jgi:hypothetical protein
LIDDNKDMVISRGESKFIFDSMEDATAWKKIYNQAEKGGVRAPEKGFGSEYLYNDASNSDDTLSIYSDDTPTQKYDIGDKVKHKLMSEWGIGIVVAIGKGKYVVKFKIDSQLKEVKDITEVELESY